jgi:hypothetical protein
MILANKLCNFQEAMQKVCRYDYPDSVICCDPRYCDPSVPKHSMWAARNAALYVQLPRWFLKRLKKAFPAPVRCFIAWRKCGR